MGTDRKCELEAEVGRICIENGSNIVPGHQPKERIYSLSFTELALKAGTELSFGDAVEMLNRLLHREENKAIKGRTYQDFCHRSGQKLTDYMAENTKKILEQAHFDNKTGKPYDEAALPSMLKETGANLPAATNIQQTIQTFNASRQSADEQIQTDAFEMEIPEETCYVSIDDIGVKHQKEHRKGSSQKQGVYVWNTVAVVQSQQDLYTLTGAGMPQVFRSTLAYLLAHGLLCHKNLVFFTDGANNIRCNIAETFSFHPYTIILDWYHLKKRCQECLSMSIRGGKEKRNLILQKLLRILWVGNVPQAVQYLSTLNPVQLRPTNRIAELCGYFTKHRDHIPCYALRHLLGLCNSSNRVEKANDLVVAQRQKHNGMSWSVCGSAALAQIKALFINREAFHWLHYHSLPTFSSIAA